MPSIDSGFIWTKHFDLLGRREDRKGKETKYCTFVKGKKLEKKVFFFFSAPGSSVLSIPGLLEVRTCGMYSYLKVDDGLHEGQDMLFSPSSHQEVMTTAAIIIFIILSRPGTYE